MKKLSIILLLSFASQHIAAMQDGGEYAPPAYQEFYQPQQQPQQQQDQFYAMAGAQPAFAAPQGMSQLARLLAINDNNDQLLTALIAQNSPLTNLCLSNQQMLSALIALHNSAAPADSQQNRNLLRAQQALARVELEDAPKRINIILSNAQQQLRERFRPSIERDYGMNGTHLVTLHGKELEDAVAAYIARMSTIEALLMDVIEDQYISEVQSDQALKLLTQAHQQVQEAKSAGLKQS